MAEPKKNRSFSPISLFYFVTGMALLVASVQPSFTPHVGFLGILSLITSYGLSDMRRWAIFLTILTSLLGIVFGCVTIYITYRMFESLEEIFLLLAMISYITVLVLSFFWLALRKDRFR